MKARKEVYPVSSPKEMGVSEKGIRAVTRAIREDRGMDLHSFLMVRKGALIWEEYFKEGEKDRLHPLYSVSKSFTSTAMGLLEAQGQVTLTDKLYDFFPEHKGLLDSERKARITLAHLLMMGSGFENNEGQIFRGREKLVEKALSQPVIHEPGRHFDYYTLGTYLLSAVFSKVKEEGIHSYLKRKIFGPLEFGTSSWSKDADGVPYGGFGLKLRAYDMTKLGALYLQKGMWEGQRLLPQEYVKAATRKQISNAHHGTNPDWTAGYGYQFWVNSQMGYRADGANGQYILVLPEKEAVIVMTSNLGDMQAPLTEIWEKLLPEMD